VPDDEPGSAVGRPASALSPRLIVLEASGGWEVLPASSLAEAGLPVAAANPRQTACMHKLLVILNALVRQHAT
jgi:transposase